MKKNKQTPISKYPNIKNNYKESWLFFLSYYKKNKKWTISIMLISTLISLTTISLPFLSSLISQFAASKDTQNIIYISSILLGISLIKIFLYFLLNYIGGIFEVKMEKHIRTEMMDKIHHLSMNTFDNTPIGVFFSRIFNDLKEAKIYVTKFIQNVVTIFCLIIGGFSFIFYVDWIAGIITLSIYLTTLFVYAFFKQNLVYHQQVNKALNTFMSIGLGEHVQMISEIKSFSNSLTTIEKFELLQDNYYESAKKYIKKTSFFKMTGIAASVLVSSSVLIIGSILSSKEIITSSELLGLVIASNILIIPIEQTSNMITDMISLNAVVVRIKEFHNWEFEINKGINKKSFLGEIEFKNVNFAYQINGKKNIVFKDFNLHIDKNKRTLLYGDYAKGKTTIFKLLLRYYEIDSGEILIDGINIKEYEIDYLRKNIAYQALIPKLFSSSLESKTLFSNVERYNKIIKSLEIEDLVAKIKKLDKNINSQGLQVSDSERQMLSIARALYFDTFIILFDFLEYCLDKNQLNAVNKTLDIFAKDKTIIFNAESKNVYFEIDNYIKI